MLVPGASLVVSTIPDHRSINASWMMLECQDRHGNIILYGVRFSSSNFMDSVNQTFNTSSGDKTSLEMTGLEEFANYTIEVRAYTAVGPGPYSNAILIQTLPDSKCIATYVCVCMVCMVCLCVCVYLHAYIHICMCMCACVCVCACMCAYACVRTCDFLTAVHILNAFFA